jgi:hypothetical protein
MAVNPEVENEKHGLRKSPRRAPDARQAVFQLGDNPTSEGMTASVNASPVTQIYLARSFTGAVCAL